MFKGRAYHSIDFVYIQKNFNLFVFFHHCTGFPCSYVCPAPSGFFITTDSSDAEITEFFQCSTPKSFHR